MSVDEIKKIFEKLETCEAWRLLLLQIKQRTAGDNVYSGRQIIICPQGRLKRLVGEVQAEYLDEKKGLIYRYEDIRDYDGTGIQSSVYRIHERNKMIDIECEALEKCIATAKDDASLSGFDPCASVIAGDIKSNGHKKQVILISMRKPVTTLKHKFLCHNGTYSEITDKVLNLRTSIDAIIYDNYVYLLSMDGERLFSLERSYKNISAQKTNEVIKEDMVSDIETFKKTASSGYNPRRFLSFNLERFNMLKSKPTREKMEKIFKISTVDGRFDTSDKEKAEKLIKILCNKGMTDPFTDNPVEVEGAKKW